MMNHYDKVINLRRSEIENISPHETASFDKPKSYGCFSLDKDRNYIPGTKNMVYYYPRFTEIKERHLKIDLNAGIEIAVRKPENLDEKLDHLLKFILRHKSYFVEHDGRLISSDFVCYRGLLTKIMCSLYLRDEWTILATKWKGSIYLCEMKQNASYNISEEEMNKFCSWGYKFEQYMVTDKFGTPPDTSKPVYESEEFCCVFKSKLGSHKIIYGAEMDGVDSSTEIDESKPDWNNIEFIELKTSKKCEKPYELRSLKRYKFIKWWCQCFLVNIKEVHCGFRNKYGIVNEIFPYKVKDLPKMSDNMWKWKTCINFCNIFFNVIKDIIPEDTNDPYSVWKIEWDPQYGKLKCQEIKGRSPHSFLPSWYIDGMIHK